MVFFAHTLLGSGLIHVTATASQVLWPTFNSFSLSLSQKDLRNAGRLGSTVTPVNVWIVSVLLSLNHWPETISFLAKSFVVWLDWDLFNFVVWSWTYFNFIRFFCFFFGLWQIDKRCNRNHGVRQSPSSKSWD